MYALMKFEWKKTLIRKSIWIVFLLFVILDIWKIAEIHKDSSYLAGEDGKAWNEAFWSMYDDYQGDITTEKINRLMELYTPLEEKTADLTASTAMDQPGTMTGNSYSDYNLLSRYYVDPMEYFYNYGIKAEKVAVQAKENVHHYQVAGNVYESRKNAVIYHLYKDREVSRFAYLEMYDQYVNYGFSNILVLLLCLYGVMGIFACEKEAKMDQLLLTNQNGRKKTMAAKIAAVSLYTAGISLLFSIVDYGAFVLAYGDAGGSALPVYSITSFSTASTGCSILQYAVVSSLTKSLGFLVIGMFFMILSRFCTNNIISFVSGMAISVLLAEVSTYFSNSSHIWGKIISPYTLVINMYLYGKTEFVSIFGYPVLSYQAAIFAGGLWLAATILVLIFTTRNNYHLKRKPEGRKLCMK